MISLARYAQLLEPREMRSVMVASLLGRLPVGIAGLAILLLAQSASGSFALGGATAAFYVAGLALLAPLMGRSIDRYGPRPVLLVCAAAFPTTLVALTAAFHWNAPAWVAFACAVAAGASFPPITVCMRTFFKRRLSDDARLATAYSLESVVIETIFIAGPMLVAFFVATTSAAMAVLFAGACSLVGTLLFLRSPALSGWHIEPRRSSSMFGPLAERGFAALLGVILCYASAFGLVEIGVTAYATEIGRPAVAGVLLGVMSVGSAAGGLIYGSRTWRLPIAKQFPLTLALMGLGVAPLAAPLPIWLFTLWCVLAGVLMAPALIMQSMQVAKTARPEHSTEAFTWSASCLLSGVGLGLSGGGALLEVADSSAVFLAAAAVAIAGALLAVLRIR